MLKQSSTKMKKVLTISLLMFLVVPLTAVLSNAQSNYADGNYHTYYESTQPGYITTDEAPSFWEGGEPVFTDEPTGINTGDIDILYRHRSPGSPEGA